MKGGREMFLSQAVGKRELVLYEGREPLFPRGKLVPVSLAFQNRTKKDRPKGIARQGTRVRGGFSAEEEETWGETDASSARKRRGRRQWRAFVWPHRGHLPGAISQSNGHIVDACSVFSQPRRIRPRIHHSGNVIVPPGSRPTGRRGASA